MRITLLLRLISTSEQEKLWIESFVKDYGFDVLVKNIEAAAISNRAKQTILDIDQILHNRSQAIQSLASITEIPVKSIRAAVKNNNIRDLVEHPERLDTDTRQLYKIRCLDNLLYSYKQEMPAEAQMLREEVQYGPER